MSYQNSMAVVKGGEEESASEESDKSTQTTRQYSTVTFPYHDLRTATGIARIAYDHYGGEAELDQIASRLDQSSESGGFRLKVSAARIFGLVTVTKGIVQVTTLGKQAVGPNPHDYLVEAFLNVPLYSQLYDEFRGHTLPDKGGLEAKIEQLGVSKKQIRTARVMFMRSADYAGFFAAGRDRLVRPPSRRIGGQADDVDNEDEDANREDQYESPKPKVMDHPLIVGLLGALPEPGQPWRQEDRDLWLEAAKMNLSLIYGRTREEREDQEGGEHG